MCNLLRVIFKKNQLTFFPPAFFANSLTLTQIFFLNNRTSMRSMPFYTYLPLVSGPDVFPPSVQAHMQTEAISYKDPV